MDSALSRTAVRLEGWANSTLACSVEAGLQSVPGLQIYCEAPELIRELADYFTLDVWGNERDFLSKSIQETLFYSVGTAPGLTRSQFGARLTRFLNRRGTVGLLRRFLSLHFFNVVWFHAGDSLRASAGTQESFLEDMEDVERTVRNIVNSAWRAQRSEPLYTSLAQEFISRVGQRLTG
jgi:hypothetical protein